MRGDEALLEALAARRGLVCLVGAGGKKTALYRLAAAHPGRVGITATVHIPPFPAALDAVRVVATQDALPTLVLEAAARSARVAFAQPSAKPDRLAGVEPAVVERICAAAGFDVCYVKADGARNRLLKGPGEDEPKVPQEAATVIPVVSARAFGQPLCERLVHRPARVSALCDLAPGEAIAPVHIARLLASGQGALKATDTATVVPLINMVDNPARRALAREAARIALELTDRFDRVVLACLRGPHPLIDVITR